MSDTRPAPGNPPHQHDDEPHAGGGNAQRLSWLRAAVLGSHDGIVSVAAIVVGVAGATSTSGPGLTGALGAKLGGSPTGRATVRVLVGGTVALGATFAIGLILGTSGVG
ncbi:VIT1/CCC1 transporter family protein [Tessaracoccus antarcticus]|uniref:VIT family protein n=1 Tax=Tessaracoccus antarcticus TaxID=2479848 RepID=A0A3M0GKP9_9ACTN|nr:hypothetical protein EAX62_06355 [Tessaracoccus antarcticus]